MLLEDQAIDHGRAARGISLWIGGLSGWLVVTFGHSAMRWYLFSDAGSYGSHDATQIVGILLRVLGIGAGLAIAVGAWRWVRATDQSSPLLPWAAAALALEPLVDIVYWGLHLTEDYGDYESRRSLYEALGHLWTVSALIGIAAFVLFFFRMARLSEAQGWTLSPTRVWVAVGSAALWGLLVATSRLDLIPFGGMLAYAIDIGMIALVTGTSIALLHSHRGHLRSGALASAEPVTSSVDGLAAAGRGLGRYHGAIISQIGFLLPANLLLMGVARSGDADAARGLMIVVMIIGLIIQLVAVSGLVTFARRMPTQHAARGAADVAAGLQTINAILGVVAVVMVIRAFSSGRLSLLFDLQDQLPVIEGFAALGGCVAAMAVLTAIERTGALGLESAGPLKAAFPALGGFVMLFKLLDPRDLGGPLMLALAVALLLTLLVTAVAFLRLVKRAATAMQMPG